MLDNAKKLLIKCEDEKPHPHCPHGPTLLFYYQEDGPTRGYFACAAFRDKRTCGFHLPATEVTAKKLSRRYELPVEKYRTIQNNFMRSETNGQRHYCHQCNVPLLDTELPQHLTHNLVRNLSEQWLQDPTKFIRSLDDDKAQAQYFFDEKALNFFAKCFEDLEITKVICIGAPRLHCFLQAKSKKVKSFLLDFDHRFFYFFGDMKFAWYNMCNNHFFDEEQNNHFRQFLKCQGRDRVLIFTDPPFGCRSEPIAHTLRKLTQQYNALNKESQQPHPVSIFWIFPYFSEHYIQQEMPEMLMCDYKINYTNHTSYTDVGEKHRKLGSPVRVFTNVPLDRLRLPVEEGYKYCTSCMRYTSLENRHCRKCGTCASKNGDTYKHCSLCDICVKPNYEHCTNCRRCAQVEGHDCKTYQGKQYCWICLKKGHIERNCVEWQKCCKKMIFSNGRNSKGNIKCLICGEQGHNERKCKHRSKYLEESTFLGEVEVTFKI